jgi:hypothetical protein
VYAPMCMYRLVRGLVCRAPIHPSRRTNPSRNGRFATTWGWLVRVKEQLPSRTSGRYTCTSG